MVWCTAGAMRLKGAWPQLPQGGDLRFVFAGLSGEEAELCPGGRDKTVT